MNLDICLEDKKTLENIPQSSHIWKENIIKISEPYTFATT